MDIDDIKKKILEDVDPETKRKRAHERRVQRFVIALQSIAVIIVVLLIFYMLMGISTVQGNSMYPTLHDQDVVIYKRKNTEYRAKNYAKSAVTITEKNFYRNEKVLDILRRICYS